MHLCALHGDLVYAPHGELVIDDRLNCGAYLIPVGRVIYFCKNFLCRYSVSLLSYIGITILFTAIQDYQILSTSMGEPVVVVVVVVVVV